MCTIGHRITSVAVAGLLSCALSRTGLAQTADTASAVSIEAVEVTVYRVKEPGKVPAAKSETKGRAPSADAIWVPGFWDLQGDRNTGRSAGWVWVPGVWLTPPVRGAHWTPAHWGWSENMFETRGPTRSRWWSWIPGHWSKDYAFIDSDDPSSN